MTRTELAALVEGSTTTSFATACSAYGLGLTRARAAYRQGERLPFRVLSIGRRLVVPTADLLRLLGPDMSEAGPARPAAAADAVPTLTEST